MFFSLAYCPGARFSLTRGRPSEHFGPAPPPPLAPCIATSVSHRVQQSRSLSKQSVGGFFSPYTTVRTRELPRGVFMS